MPANAVTLEATYEEIEAATPTFDPESGTYNSDKSVEISCTTNGAEIYYTTDGTDPTKNNSKKYSVPIVVSKTITIKAIAVKNGMDDSAVSTATYTINKKDQSITASDITKTTADAAFSIGASTSGNGQLTYKSGKTGVVTVDGNGKVTIKGAGTTMITIIASETANYNKATKTIKVTVTSKSTDKKSIAKVKNNWN